LNGVMTWANDDVYIISHSHLDHNSFEFAAAKGWMRGKPVICTTEVARVLDRKMANLGVPRADRPQMICLDRETNLPLRDNEGRVRMWVQHMPHGALHSAPTPLTAITPCVGDDFYGPTVLLCHD